MSRNSPLLQIPTPDTKDMKTISGAPEPPTAERKYESKKRAMSSVLHAKYVHVGRRSEKVSL